MKPIHLIPLVTAGGGLGFDRLEHLAANLARAFRTPCRIRPQMLDIGFALDERRGQFHSTAILQRLERQSDPGVRVLGVTTADLFVPVLTFVFGEAEMPGRAAVFSIARLREEFYGLPPNRPLLLTRALRELWHEVGHLRGLPHCKDWSCLMSSSHSVERVDAKGDVYCAECQERWGA